MGTYYYLVAGLPDLTLEDSKLNYTVADFRTEIYPQLTAADKKLVDLFYLQYDNANVLRLLKNKETNLLAQGNFAISELIDGMEAVKEGAEVKKFPSYLTAYLTGYYQAPAGEEPREDALTAGYYAYAMQIDNAFVSAWFEFSLNVNNILNALTSRKYKWEVAANVVGHSEVCEALRSSGARDFGLSGEVEYWEAVQKISEIEELTEREKKLDTFRWNWMEEHTFFDYFGIEPLFVFLLKLEMIERWLRLDKEKGSELFRRMIEELKNEVRIPTEFK